MTDGMGLGSPLIRCGCISTAPPPQIGEGQIRSRRRNGTLPDYIEDRSSFLRKPLQQVCVVSGYRLDHYLAAIYLDRLAGDVAGAF